MMAWGCQAVQGHVGERIYRIAQERISHSQVAYLSCVLQQTGLSAGLRFPSTERQVTYWRRDLGVNYHGYSKDVRVTMYGSKTRLIMSSVTAFMT